VSMDEVYWSPLGEVFLVRIAQANAFGALQMHRSLCVTAFEGRNQWEKPLPSTGL